MNTSIRQTYTKTKRMTSAWEKRFEDRYWYRKRNQHPHTWTSTFAYPITHPKRTSETQEERDAECQHMSKPILNCFTAWQHWWSWKPARVSLKTNWTNSWNCFQNTLRVQGQKWRDTAQKRPSTKINWCGASHIPWEHDDWLSRKKDFQIGTAKKRTDTSVRTIRT